MGWLGSILPAPLMRAQLKTWALVSTACTRLFPMALARPSVLVLVVAPAPISPPHGAARGLSMGPTRYLPPSTLVATHPFEMTFIINSQPPAREKKIRGKI